ncbi:MAG: hypothetical protein ACI8Z5_000666 [Lentimonas sp.]|jgi:hypothetical protein
MFEKIRNLSQSDLRRLQLLIIFGLIGLYTPFYLHTSERLFDAKKQVSRREDRIEKRTSLDDFESGGPNLRTLANRIKNVTEELSVVSATFEKRYAGFVPVESGDLQQQLMLEISTLAAQTGVKLLSVSRKGSLQQGATAVDRALGRPLIDITAKAQFIGLLTFLNDLENLSYHVSVINLKLYSKNPKGESDADRAEPGNHLYVELQMSL